MTIYFSLFFEFFKIGLFTFGGGYAMIPLVQNCVITNNWLTDAEFYNFIGVCESTPGPIAINMATYVGSVQGGLLGSISATFGVVLPSFIVIVLICTLFKNLTNNKYFDGFLKGVKPIIIALILSTGVTLLAKSFGYVSLSQLNIDWISVITFSLVALIFFGAKKLFQKKLSAVSIIVISAILGIVLSVISEKIVS